MKLQKKACIPDEYIEQFGKYKAKIDIDNNGKISRLF
jgi:formyltetrahydrofolate synthetase